MEIGITLHSQNAANPRRETWTMVTEVAGNFTQRSEQIQDFAEDSLDFRSIAKFFATLIRSSNLPSRANSTSKLCISPI